MRRLLLALALLAPFPGTASAAVVDAYPGDEIEDGMVSITDARGQRNSLTLIARNGRVAISERGTAALQAGDGCRQRAPRRVTCSVIGDYSYGLYAELGSGDDSLSLTDPGYNLVDIEIQAGPGNDRVALTTPSGGVVYGGPGSDMLRGSAVGDYLQGGSGGDRLFGRGGADVLVGDTPGPRWAANDLLDGGRGRDTASWEGRTGSVHVD